ncbi:hypothetical protein B0H17DRAFT_1163610 [Mycena rosella]|uniref:Uncharacterized protein n=1 Tax=Mycena rosella TaxID=1033263 RepID=A0AAD7G076_MYCRO|nr:hypothetical protein B0H17DRAFT_1163610 [Mycena rosella]
MPEEDYGADGSPIFDSLDIDLFVKVFANTAFSTSCVSDPALPLTQPPQALLCHAYPTFYIFQGAKLTDTIVVGSSIYYVFVSLFWLIKWVSRLYSNQGSLFYAPRPVSVQATYASRGGSSGVGELLANTMAVKSVTVVVLDVKPIQTRTCDVSKWEEVEAVSKKIVKEIGHPTVLINNAGVVQGKLLLDLSPEDIQQYRSSRPMIEKKKGHIVTMASAMGIHGVAQMTDYCASKAASSELDKRVPAIRTTLVCPGHIHTALFATLNAPPQFFFPTLHPIEVVKRVIKALDETHSQTIYLPFYTHFLPVLQLLPDFFSDLASWLSNADFAMKDFVKLSGRRRRRARRRRRSGATASKTL